MAGRRSPPPWFRGTITGGQFPGQAEPVVACSNRCPPLVAGRRKGWQAGRLSSMNHQRRMPSANHRRLSSSNSPVAAMRAAKIWRQPFRQGRE